MVSSDARRARRPTESEIAGAADKLETMVSSIGEYFLPAGQTWRAAGVVAGGEIDYLVNFHPRQICQVVYDYRGGPHMRSLISIDFPAPEMEPESAHVASAVSVP